MYLRGMGERGGAPPSPTERGGTPPEQARTPFVCGLIQEMGGNPQDLSSPFPIARQSKGEGIREEAQGGTRIWEGVSTP